MSVFLNVTTPARWLGWITGGLEVIVDETTELFDEMSLAVMANVEAIKERRLAGDDLSVEALVERFMDPSCPTPAEPDKKLTPTEHRQALAVLAAVAMRYLADDTH